IKRNRFTTFILHLAIADNGFLASIVIYDLHQFTYFLGSRIFYHFCAFFSHMMYINANFLLTAISIDRCVAVLFPIWHRCSRPKDLSSIVCVLLWISSFLLSGIMSIVLFTDVFGKYSLFGLPFLLIAIVSLPLITLSTLVLFIKVCVKPKQKNQGQLLLMILITLLCFLTLAFPLNVFVVILNFFSIQAGPDLRYWEAGVILFFCLKSSINPLIYFLVGRKKGAQTNKSMKIKRNRFTTFILHLAIADSGYLTSVVIYKIHLFTYFLRSKILFLFCAFFSHMMYINANFLLTAISIDRCVAVFFPIWHRCSRPKHLSSIVCVLLWISSFLLSGIMSIRKGFVNYTLVSFHFLVTAIICLPLITLSTLVLFIKVCLKSNQKNQGRLLLMILMTLLCFLILAFPLSVLSVIVSFCSLETYNQLEYWGLCGMLFSYLNSSINPVIYFLVGRKKGAQTKESMKVILQKVFKEGEATGER
ncbi:Mas-related G-protein coupled receptor member H, partial [Ophiophagus hannah]